MHPFSMLVFDPHPALLRMLVRYLEEQHSGMLIIAGAAFREADALVLAMATSPEVVLLGMRGPMTHALQLIVALRCLLPTVIIVMMNDLGMAGYAQAALDGGADTFVDKDHLNADLIPAILQVARARDSIPAAVLTASDTR